MIKSACADSSQYPPASSRQLRGAITHLLCGSGELQHHLARKGRENASVWDGGQRRHSSQMLGCNGQDTVKARQGKPEEMIANGRGGESR